MVAYAGDAVVFQSICRGCRNCQRLECPKAVNDASKMPVQAESDVDDGAVFLRVVNAEPDEGLNCLELFLVVIVDLPEVFLVDQLDDANWLVPIDFFEVQIGLVQLGVLKSLLLL